MAAANEATRRMCNLQYGRLSLSLSNTVALAEKIFLRLFELIPCADLMLRLLTNECQLGYFASTFFIAIFIKYLSFCHLS